MISDPDQLSNKQNEITQVEMASAVYHMALPPVVDEFVSGSDYIQIRIWGKYTCVLTAGTDDKEDMKNNLQTDLVDFHGHGLAHSGWAESVDQMAGTLRRALKDYIGSPIKLIGHSRGGSIMQLFSILITKEWDEHVDLVDDLITYGAPHPGNEELCKSIEDSCRVIHRYENNTLPVPWLRDPIPHVPFTADFSSPGVPIKKLAFGLPIHQHRIATYIKTISR